MPTDPVQDRSAPAQAPETEPDQSLWTRPAPRPREPGTVRPPTREPRPVVQVTSYGMFVAAFLFLLGAGTAVAIAQFEPGSLSPWLSIGYSGGAILCTLIAVIMRRR